MAATNAPKAPGERRRRNAPVRGDWQPTERIGWQYGPIPEAPEGINDATRVAWATWFAAWFASYWTPADLPGLRHLIRLYDLSERGAYQRASELRMLMDTYGITPKGQQDRRWKRPDELGTNVPTLPERESQAYGHLRSVKGA